MYLIDLCHLDIFEDEKERDDGFLLGLYNVMQLLKEIAADDIKK